MLSERRLGCVDIVITPGAVILGARTNSDGLIVQSWGALRVGDRAAKAKGEVMSTTALVLFVDDVNHVGTLARRAMRVPLAAGR